MRLSAWDCRGSFFACFLTVAHLQTPGVLDGLYTISTIVPAALLFCVTLMLLFVYPLGKKVEENSEILKNRRLSK